MKYRVRYVLLVAAFLALPALAQEEYVELVKRMQIALHLQGFDPGPINGVNEGRTQAALAQFQLSRNLPASGAMDEATLKELGVSPEATEAEIQAEGEENASAGAGMPLARP
jgi:peptidoglycan hydrolase-like protein with peptidoglycan-binding domain